MLAVFFYTTDKNFDQHQLITCSLWMTKPEETITAVLPNILTLITELNCTNIELYTLSRDTQ